MFEVMFVGVGDAFSEKHWGTNFLCRDDDFVLAVDCPDSYRRALKATGFTRADGSRLDAQHIDAMFLTHLHGDHVNGLEMLLAYRKFVAGGKLALWTTPDVADVLWERRLSVSLHVLYDGAYYNEMHLEDFVDLHVVPWGTTAEIGPFTVETRQTIHHIPTAGLRVRSGEKTLGYSCDTAWDPEHVAWLENADTLIHETSLGPAHTPMFRLLELPEAVRRKLLVVHYPDIVAEPTGELRFAREGMIHEVGQPTL